MGGYGSGRWHRWGARETTGGCLPLDVRLLQRLGLLTEGLVRSCSWDTDGGKQIASFTLEAHGDHVVVTYQAKSRTSGEQQGARERLPLSWSPCNYGGRRPWWLCPRCGRRVAILYHASGLFACRHCHGLAYPSQREGRPLRCLHRGQRIRRRLGGSGSSMEAFPDKPRMMHWQTYMQLWHRCILSEGVFFGVLRAEMHRNDAQNAAVMAELARRGLL